VAWAWAWATEVTVKQYLAKTYGKHEGLNTLMIKQGMPVNNETMNQ